MSFEKLGNPNNMSEPTEAVPRHSDATRFGGESMPITEKEEASRELEKAQTNLARVATFSKDLERRVRRKLDWNIVPLITVVYMLSVLDRSNIGNARIAGMQEDLDLTGNKYQWLLTIFYIPCTHLPKHPPPYLLSILFPPFVFAPDAADILFEWLTICWKLFPPHRYAATVVFLWGTIATLQAAAQTWAGMMVLRFFLGAVECGFGPGLPLYLSFFYPRHEVGLRIGIFLAGSAAANAYGGVLAYGLSHITSGIAPWRLLFILEGVPTCLMAIVIWFFLPDGPGKAKFLNAEEKEVAVARAMRQPRSFEKKGLDVKQLFAAFKDYKNFLTALMYFGCNVSFASLPVFLPTIIAEMGAFTAVQSNGLTAPPYVFCFIIIISCAFLSDRFHNRGYFVAGNAFIAAIGFLIMATVDTTGVRYFAIFLCTLIFVSVAMILAWVTNNAGTDSKRAGGLWILTTIGQCGPLLGTSIFPSDEGPYYRKGMWICCAFCFFVFALATTLSLLLRRENRRRDEKYGKGTGVDAFDENVDAGTLGDNAPTFRYVC